MTLPVFHYMVWAKSRAGGARWNLAQSGLAAPGPEFLPLGALESDLSYRGGDMPDEARARVAARFGVSPERVALSLGTSQGLFLLTGALLGRGDDALVERPAYGILPLLPAWLGAAVHRFERREEDGFRLPRDLPERVVKTRPRLVIVTNPHNPSGVVLDPQADLAPLAKAVAGVGGTLLVDEVYMEFLPDAAERTAYRPGGCIAVTSSLTKAFGLGTVRFGWILAEPAIVERALRFNDLVSVLFPAPSGWVGVEALRALATLQRRAVEIRERNLPILEDWALSRADVGWVRPGAGIIAFPRLKPVADTMSFSERLREEHDVQVVPGEFFEAPGHVRIGFGAEEGVLREGLLRLSRALDAVKG